MPVLLLFIAFVVLIGCGGWWMLTAPPARVAAVLRAVVPALLVAGGLFLVLSGKLPWVGTLLGMAAPFLARRMIRRQFARILGGMGDGRPSQGQSSTVQTRFVTMTLDLDSGAMDGSVNEGTFAGRGLASLSLHEALALWQETATDAQSLRVLEAWLDRAHVGWRDHVDEQPDAADGPAMDEAEAYALLGLTPPCTARDIRAAYRRVMAKMHPDRGGSHEQAARLSAARDLLLRLVRA